MVISTAGWLVLTVIGLAILFIFFSLLVPAVGDFMGAIVGGIINTVCNQLGLLSGICHMVTGS